MTLEEANRMLDQAPCGIAPARINPGMTQAQAVDIVRKGINGPRALQADGVNLDPMLEKRVWQVFKNQKRPKY